MSRFILGLLASVALATLSTTAFAADYAASPRVRSAEAGNPYCSELCGCPIVTFTRHRRLEMGYPSGFDPRAFEEPRFYWGARKTYTHFENNCPHRVF
jgi:hypothetical protein